MKNKIQPVLTAAGNPTVTIEQLKELAERDGNEGAVATKQLIDAALSATAAVQSLWKDERHRWKVEHVARWFEELPATFVHHGAESSGPSDATSSTHEMQTALNTLRWPFNFSGQPRQGKGGRARKVDLLNNEIEDFAKCIWFGSPFSARGGVLVKLPSVHKLPPGKEDNPLTAVLEFYQAMRFKLITPQLLADKGAFASAFTNAFLDYVRSCRPFILEDAEIVALVQKREAQREASQSKRKEDDFHFDKGDAAHETALREVVRSRVATLLK